MSNESGTSAYAVPIPPATTPWPVDLGPDGIMQRLACLPRDSIGAQLDRIEAKLDELLRRTAPEAAQVEEIRRRVREALGEKP